MSGSNTRTGTRCDLRRTRHTSTCGLAFVGLIVPHFARRLVGPAHAALVPASAFLGGVLLVVTDVIARTLFPPNELPLGVLTSLIGVPCFIVVLQSLARRGGAA